MSITEIIKKFKSYMILGDALLQLETFVWILNHISDQSQHNLLCGGVSLSISKNSKLAPVP